MNHFWHDSLTTRRFKVNVKILFKPFPSTCLDQSQDSEKHIPQWKRVETKQEEENQEPHSLTHSTHGVQSNGLQTCAKICARMSSTSRHVCHM